MQAPFVSPMGRLCTKFLTSVGCLILLLVTGSGSIKVLGEPTCFSDYIRTSTCEWFLDSAVDCSSQLCLHYRLMFFEFSENLTCIPRNSASTVCVCHMEMNRPVQSDRYQMELWAEHRQLWQGSFSPSGNVKPLAPDNLTLHTNVSDEWLLTWNNLYPSNNLLYKDLISMVNISREDNPAEVSGRHGSLPLPGHRLGRMLRLWSRVLGRGYSELESSLSARLCPRHVRPLPGPEFAVCSCVGQCSVA